MSTSDDGRAVGDGRGDDGGGAGPLRAVLLPVLIGLLVVGAGAYVHVD